MDNKVLEQLKEEYNELLNRAQDIGEIIANCTDIDTNHCGQDADMDDACCQVKGVKPTITGESLRNLLGMQVCRCNVPCDVCAIDKRVGACVKLELVGGDYICLAPTPNTTTAIDDSPKSFEEAYRDSMNLLREFCIKQGEANQRLVNALKKESEELKRPVISFDEENEECLDNIIGDIKEDVDKFMDCIDVMFKKKTTSHDKEL